MMLVKGWSGSEIEQAIVTYEKASSVAGADTPQWQIDFTMAQWIAAAGDLEAAAEFAQSALQLSPAEAQEQIQGFLVRITTGSVESDG